MKLNLTVILPVISHVLGDETSFVILKKEQEQDTAKLSFYMETNLHLSYLRKNKNKTLQSCPFTWRRIFICHN